MHGKLISWITAQAILLVLGASWHSSTSAWPSSIFFGVLSAHFALLGLWISSVELPIGPLAVYGLGACVCLILLATILSQLNEWEILLAGLRLPMLGFVFGALRLLRNYKIVRQQSAGQISLLHFSTRQMFWLVLGCGLTLTIVRAVNYDSDSDWLLWLIVMLLGLSGSLVAVVAAAVALSRLNALSMATSAIVLIMLLLGLAWFTLSQTDSLITAARSATAGLIEALVVIGSLANARTFGYQLVQR